MVLTNRSTLRASYALAFDVVSRGVPGALVEAGVYAGAQLAAAWRAASDAGDRRRLIAFDSFQGIPEAGEEDNLQPRIGPKTDDAAGRMQSSGVAVCTIAGFTTHMVHWGVPLADIEIREGWFEDTMPAWDGEPIAWLRIDCDLYASTSWAISTLYPWLQPGGICIVDDYVLKGCQEAIDRYPFATKPTMTPIEGGVGAVYWKRG